MADDPKQEMSKMFKLDKAKYLTEKYGSEPLGSYVRRTAKKLGRKLGIVKERELLKTPPRKTAPKKGPSK